MSPTRAPVRGRRPLRLVALATVGVALLSGCSARDIYTETLRTGWPDPVTKQGQEVFDLWIGSAAAALVIGVFVWLLIFWAGFRYRKRSDELPRQVRYNLPIEVLYTVVPFVIIAVLFFYTARTETDINKLSKNPDVVVGVVGFQWNWQFNYVKEKLQVTGRPGQPAELVLPVGRTIRFVETSPDVIHSFWVPQFLFKRDVVPGRTNTFEITINKTGRWVGRCAELCGEKHDRMDFFVHAVTQQEYADFVQVSQRRGDFPAPPLTVDPS